MTAPRKPPAPPLFMARRGFAEDRKLPVPHWAPPCLGSAKARTAAGKSEQQQESALATGGARAGAGSCHSRHSRAKERGNLSRGDLAGDLQGPSQHLRRFQAFHTVSRPGGRTMQAKMERCHHPFIKSSWKISKPATRFPSYTVILSQLSGSGEKKLLGKRMLGQAMRGTRPFCHVMDSVYF